VQHLHATAVNGTCTFEYDSFANIFGATLPEYWGNDDNQNEYFHLGTDIVNALPLDYSNVQSSTGEKRSSFYMPFRSMASNIYDTRT